MALFLPLIISCVYVYVLIGRVIKQCLMMQSKKLPVTIKNYFKSLFLRLLKRIFDVEDKSVVSH